MNLAKCFQRQGAEISPVREVPFPFRAKLNQISLMITFKSKQILRKVQGPSDCVNRLVIVRKPNNEITLCMDPKYLNMAIKREHCLMSTFEQITFKLVGSKYFSTVK